MESGIRTRALLVCLVLVAGLSALSVRLISIQVWDRKLSDKSTIPRFILEEKIPANRGLIVDRNDKPIAQNRPEAALIADVNHLNFYDNLTRAVAHRYASQVAGWTSLGDVERSEILAETRRQVVGKLTRDEVRAEHLEYALDVISRELRIPTSELAARVPIGNDARKKRIVVEKGIREDQARKIEHELQARRIQGFSFERSQRRFYPMPTFAPHLVGYIDHTGVGRAGIEKAMQDILAGIDGERELKRDENGLVNLTDPKKVRPPKHGKHVKVTFDMGIQAIAEEELEMACQAYNTDRGSIIIVDPHTGDVLAMASRPHFNLNLKENVDKAGTNFATATEYEAGSVMKIVSMSAALNERVAYRGSVVNCGWGRIQRKGYYVPDHHAYGDLTFDKVLMKSSNTGAFLFAEMIGRAKYYEYLDAFGFGQATGFLVSGEGRGRVSDPMNMQHFASATYGYGLSVTPLQLAMAYSVVANGGNLMKPRLIDSIIAGNGNQVESVPVTVVRRVLSEQAADQMCLAFEQVVKDGTGRLGAVPGLRVGGKTGTAWKWNNEIHAYDKSRKILTFSGVVPVPNPKFVCVVTIDEPTGLGELAISGGTIAGPVFSNVSSRVASYLNIPLTEPVPETGSSIALAPRQ
jgi:cell division protein FtsI/penicillin-binding protein 2